MFFILRIFWLVWQITRRMADCCRGELILTIFRLATRGPKHVLTLLCVSAPFGYLRDVTMVWFDLMRAFVVLLPQLCVSYCRAFMRVGLLYVLITTPFYRLCSLLWDFPFRVHVFWRNLRRDSLSKSRDLLIAAFLAGLTPFFMYVTLLYLILGYIIATAFAIMHFSNASWLGRFFVLAFHFAHCAFISFCALSTYYVMVVKYFEFIPLMLRAVGQFVDDLLTTAGISDLHTRAWQSYFHDYHDARVNLGESYPSYQYYFHPFYFCCFSNDPNRSFFVENKFEAITEECSVYYWDAPFVAASLLSKLPLVEYTTFYPDEGRVPPGYWRTAMSPKFGALLLPTSPCDPLSFLLPQKSGLGGIYYLMRGVPFAFLPFNTPCAYNPECFIFADWEGSVSTSPDGPPPLISANEYDDFFRDVDDDDVGASACGRCVSGCHCADGDDDDRDDLSRRSREEALQQSRFDRCDFTTRDSPIDSDPELMCSDPSDTEEKSPDSPVVRHFRVASGPPGPADLALSNAVQVNAVMTAFNAMRASFDAMGVDSVEITRFLGVACNMFTTVSNPVSLGSLLLAAYPRHCMDLFSSVSSKIVGASLPTLQDFLTMLVTDIPEPVAPVVVASSSRFTVASGPAENHSGNPILGMMKSLRKEFVTRLLLDEVVRSFIVPGSSLAYWVAKYCSGLDGSIVNFCEGLFVSCVRVFAHIRYYIDGDLEKYLKSLDVESAALYRFSVLELYLLEHGYDEKFLARVDGEIDAFERLLPKTVSTKSTFMQVTECLSSLRRWRSQCYAKLNDGDLPFGLMVAGPERAGKSELMEQLRILIATNKRCLVSEVNVARPRESDKFDTEISPSTHVVLFQDSFKDAVASERRSMLNLLFDLAGGQCIPLTKARLEEKGTYAAPPLAIFVSTNDSTMKLDGKGLVFDNHSALASRLQYGLRCAWDGDPESDPKRERVRWFLGSFDKKSYDRGEFPYKDSPDIPWTGGPFTIPEVIDRLQIAYDAHVTRNKEFAADRKARCVQCEKCFKYSSNCKCLAVASGPSLPFDSTHYHYFGFLSYTLILVAWVWIVEHLAYFAFIAGTWWKAYTFCDSILIWFRKRWDSLSPARRARFPKVGAYVRSVPQFVICDVGERERLQTLRTMKSCLPVVVAAVIGFGLILWRWRDSPQPAVATPPAVTVASPSLPTPTQAVQPVPMHVAADVFPLSEPAKSPSPYLPMPGETVTDMFQIERACGRCYTVDGAQNFLRLDEHSMLTVSHLIAHDLDTPRVVNFNFPKSWSDKLIPELCTVDRSLDMMLVATPGPIRFDAPKPTLAVFDDSANLFVTGYCGITGVLKRRSVRGRCVVGTEKLTYDDPRKPGIEYTLPPRTYVMLSDVYGPGTCGSILHDGATRAFGLVVANSADCSVVRLFPDGNLNSLRNVGHTPLAPPRMLPLRVACAVRGLHEEPKHFKSCFQRDDVLAHWDYQFTVRDDAHMQPRATRVRGPHVEAFEALSGIPASSLLEATGAPGRVEGVPHNVSPMEHFFNKHSAAQARPSPILDTDPLPEVAEYVDYCISKMTITWTEPLSTEVALYGDGVIKPMAMDKSAGFPQCAKRDLMSRGPTGEILAGPALIAALDVAYDEFLDGVCKPGIFRPFPKQGEILPAEKIRAGMSRVIMNHLGFVQSVVVRRIMLPILLNLIANRTLFGILVGLCATNPEHVERLAREMGYGKPGVSSLDGDFRAFDLSQRARIAAFVYRLMYGVAVKMRYSQTLLLAVRFCFYLWLYPVFVYRGDVWVAKGDIWGSGQLGTEVFQSLCAWFLHLIATILFLRAKLVVSRAPLVVVVAEQDRAAVKVYGDDNHRNHYHDSISGEDLASYIAGCGYTITDNHDKTKAPMPAPNVSILKRSIQSVSYDGLPMLTMPLEISSVVKSLYWPKKDKNGRCDAHIYSSSLHNANREIFLHGPNRFAEWHPVLSRCWESLSIQGSPPADWPELLATYRSGTLETWDSGGQLPI